MGSRHRSAPSGDLPDAIRQWCRWIWTQAELAHRVTPDRRTPEGGPATIFDFMGQASERPLMEAAIKAGIFVPAVSDSSDDKEDIFA